jgi:Protein of unknown function (DUF3277)
MAVATFDPKSVVITIGPYPLSGFADGTFLELSQDTQQFTKTVGADGFTTRVKSNDYGATLTVTLAQSSPANDYLSALAATDRATNLGVVPILIKDLSGTSIIFAATGWIQQIPDATWGNEINNLAWIFDLADADTFLGGNGVAN